MLATNTLQDDCYVAAEINIDALRYYREKARFQNWIPYIRAEIYRKLYEQPIWPKNNPNMQHAEAEQVFNKAISDLQARGTYRKR